MSELIIHVGVMKSGTTYLQEVMTQSRAELQSHGWLYPEPRMNQQHACYGLCGSDIYWVRSNNPYGSLGKRLLTDIAAHDGKTIVSAEALSSLQEAGIERFLAQTGIPDRIVFTVRGLDKLVPSAWQQNLKSGSTESYTEFLDRLAPQRINYDGPWRTYAFGENIKKWARFAPVEVVIVPRKPEKPSELWDLFREATGLPQVKNTTVKADSANISLDAESAEILLRLNQHCTNSKMAESSSREARMKYITHALFPLSHTKLGTPIQLPPHLRDVVREWNEDEVSKLREHSARIHGSVEDLYAPESNSSPISADFSAIAAQHILQLVKLIKK